ncbi:MAG: type I DNA topoisomerase [Subdoligranulum variabile]|uniref:type I DNA topoisomerase n=1 Tax=Gemmiger sp. TaxID=2049027 RepID=UPI0025F82F17|nr:type I DNA topoisomerase [Gemmiger sp.]MCI6141460.1 type I DNA topoisomerase [Subdoligranulum variabile]MCI6385367.1 type I DNA topoisomerase [Subdoligranulum variabile]MCI7641767.1 type I DNA topoisomerase [Subdoligranulum variabile]MDD6609313.1 type I DNA topoisomerase [Subdoligranulum variabile]MDD6649710.1 type I DNA topoisomerase [Subdoligranulum variabile]
MPKLVIVESPAKAKTISKYLGRGYKVTASMGHVRDLPASQLGIDVDNGFAPKYITIKGKQKLVKELKAEAKKCDGVLLATDPDREGEAISWHLANILGLDPTAPNRVTFDEITKKGVKEGMAHPRAINIDLFNAQQARRELDRLVGYKLSPFLWRKVRRGLSAGRVQSVAVRLIRDRELEIENFKPDEYWNIDAALYPQGNSKNGFTARLAATADGKKLTVTNKAQADTIVAALDGKSYTISKLEKGKRRRQPAPPFITSTLQQDASRAFGFSATRTMRAAQTLYEGVDIAGHGTVGLITYMRTDSLRIAAEASAAAKKFIAGRWGENYVCNTQRKWKSRSATAAQDAHEAIRPSMPELTPDEVEQSISGDTAKLYRLIWSRFMASQMADCVQDTVSVSITAGDYLFRASGFRVSFDGFTALYEESTDDKQKKETALPPLEEGQTLKLRSLTADQKFTQPPPLYTEATLIHALEENGIGRPSTYAPIITTIVDRGYVEKDQKKLKTTPLGQAVNTVMMEQFPNIVDVKFSADMEKKLDIIEAGKADWVATIDDFYQGFAKSLEDAEKNMEGKRVKVEDIPTDEICEKCGRPMVIKSGRYGKFVACSGFPECRNAHPLIKDTGGICPECGGHMLVRKSAKGRIYYGCGNYPKCNFMTWDEPVSEKCPQCGQTLFKKKGQLYCAKEGCGFTKPVEKK